MRSNRRILLLICLLCALLSARQLYAAPQPVDPSPGYNNQGIIQRIGKWALLRWSEKRLKNVSDLDEQAKTRFLAKSSRAGVAIILYEFATGTGPSIRYLDERTQFARDIVKGPAIKYLTEEYVALHDGDGSLTLRYQFSPLPQKPGTWPFGLKHHLLTLTGGHLSQFMLGSFYASYDPRSNGHIHVHIWNITSRKSYFLRIGPRVQRPLPFGNVTQHVFIDLSPEEQNAILSR